MARGLGHTFIIFAHLSMIPIIHHLLPSLCTMNKNSSSILSWRIAVFVSGVPLWNSTFVGPVMERHVTVGNCSKLCYFLTSFTITYVPTTCESLFRGNTNRGFIRPNIFPWGTSKSGGSFQDFFRGFFPHCSIGFPEVVLVR